MPTLNNLGTNINLLTAYKGPFLTVLYNLFCFRCGRTMIFAALLKTMLGKCWRERRRTRSQSSTTSVPTSVPAWRTCPTLKTPSVECWSLIDYWRSWALQLEPDILDISMHCDLWTINSSTLGCLVHLKYMTKYMIVHLSLNVCKDNLAKHGLMADKSKYSSSLGDCT